MKIQLEVGEFYRTRGGQKVFISARANSLDEFFGCILGSQDAHTWADDGLYANGLWHWYTIISKWEEPAEGWLEWKGGACPVDGESRVIVEYRDGVRTDEVAAREVPWNASHPAAVPAKYRIASEPEKKVYKLSEMWKLWKIGGVYTSDVGTEVCYMIFNTLEAANKYVEDNRAQFGIWMPLAITRADATEFFAGEGL